MVEAGRIVPSELSRESIHQRFEGATVWLEQVVETRGASELAIAEKAEVYGKGACAVEESE